MLHKISSSEKKCEGCHWYQLKLNLRVEETRFPNPRSLLERELHKCFPRVSPTFSSPRGLRSLFASALVGGKFLVGIRDCIRRVCLLASFFSPPVSSRACCVDHLKTAVGWGRPFSDPPGSELGSLAAVWASDSIGHVAFLSPIWTATSFSFFCLLCAKNGVLISSCLRMPSPLPFLRFFSSVWWQFRTIRL